jgi:hypothetical protein
MKGKVQKGMKVDNATPTDIYAGANSGTVKGARGGTNGFKKGGKVHKDEAMDKALIKKMMKSKDRKEGGKVDGVMSKAHAGRKPRMSGGGVFSTAAKGSKRPGFED